MPTAQQPDHIGTGDRLGETMAELAMTLQKQHRSIDGTLESITRSAVRMVPGVHHAGITLVVGRRRLEPRAATDKLPLRIDQLQTELGEGPCLDAIWEQHTVEVPDMSTEKRWPRFAKAAAESGVRSMLSFQLYTHQDNLGALNLYSDVADGFDDTSHEVGLLLATHAAIALIAAQRETQLQSALASRDVIGQAKGIVMERYGVDAVRAFELLSRLSQEWNIPVAEIARRVVSGNAP
ncbi:MAG: GAF and ANTAR domain-containing protein [Rhodococcus sp. (in: high G+C Gram-positive bacteria)]|uniref:ANTAR domain-containing protein n=1 Tax=Rhodococcus sp. TaxID=1831 RepID=UPI003BAFD5C4